MSKQEELKILFLQRYCFPLAKIEILNAIATHFKIKVCKELAPGVLCCKDWLALNECKKLGHQRNFKMLDE